MSDPDEEIDVVVMDFSIDDFSELRLPSEVGTGGVKRETSDCIVTAVHTLQPGSGLTANDFEPYAEGTNVDTLWGDYARAKW
jgi:hypothetical protein